MKLNEQQIRFIDTYLKNSGVEYVDIRCEMTDHVASALESQEGDFEANFKRYMLQHKKGLLASNRKFRWQAGRKAALLLFGNLVRPRFLAILATIFLATYFMIQIFPPEEVMDSYFACFVIFIAILFLYNWYLRLSGRSRFSVLNYVLAIAYTIVYIAVFVVRGDRYLSTEVLLVSYYAGFSAFIIEVFFTYKQLMAKYKTQYGS